MELKHGYLTKKFRMKTYVDGNGLFEDIGQMLSEEK